MCIRDRAMASPNSGANYDYISSSLEQIQKAFKNHDVGTDEFRAFVDYLTFEDMSLASIDDLDVYKRQKCSSLLQRMIPTQNFS